MSLRKTISLILIFSFLIMLVTGLLLFVVPPGRISYWANWTFAGLTKEQWGNLHITSGLMGLIAALFHIYFNWKPIMQYLKNRQREFRVFTVDFNVALLITLFVTLGTAYEMPPFSWILDLSEDIKNEASVVYGEPPYAHAELSPLTEFAEKMQIDLSVAKEKLATNGITVSSDDETILSISERNDVSPQALYLMMKELNAGKQLTMPELPGQGTGKKTVRMFCEQYNLDLDATLKFLADNKYPVDPDMNLKTIATEFSTDPITIYGLIRQASLQAAK
jgi:hypothetical protein